MTKASVGNRTCSRGDFRISDFRIPRKGTAVRYAPHEPRSPKAGVRAAQSRKASPLPLGGEGGPPPASSSAGAGQVRGSRARQCRSTGVETSSYTLDLHGFAQCLFSILDARGAISVTERVALIARIRKLAFEVAAIYLDRQTAREVPA